MNMAEGGPPNKRAKTEGDVYMLLEDSLPDDLISGNSEMPANNVFSLKTSQNTSQPTPQTNKKLTQLLQSGTNSPKHGQATSSPNSNNSPRPQQQHTPHPQPSPLSTAQNSLQSPNAGSMAAVRNSLKSPPSLPRPNSRPSSAISATPSPRPVSMPVGTMSMGGMANSALAASANNPQRNPLGSGMNSHSMSMPSSVAPVMPSNQDKLNMANGINRLNPGMPNMGNDLQNDMGMQMGGQQMINQQPGNFMGQPRMQSQVGGPMHTMNPPMNNIGQQPHVNMTNWQRPMVNSGGFNDPSMSRSSGMMPSGGGVQNHLGGDGLGMDGSMMMGDKPGDNMQMIQPSSNMNMMGTNMPMQQVRPNMTMVQSGNMQQQHQRNDLTAGIMTQDTGQQQQLQQMQMTSNHSVLNPMQPAAGQDQMVNMVNRNQPGAASTSTPADPEKRRLIQQQLVLLLHAYKCSKKEHSGNPTHCTLPHCKTMKEVLNHMNVCTQGKSCTVAHCASSRQIIAHWRACNRQDCVVCLPLKSVPNHNSSAASGTMQPRWQTPVSQIGGDSSMQMTSGTPNHVPTGSNGPPYPGNFNDPLLDPSVAMSQSNPITSQGLGSLPNGITVSQVPGMVKVGAAPLGGQNMFQPPRVEREWHKDVKEELRNHLVQKLVQAIFPTPQKVSLTDERMKKLVTFARKVEKDMYDQANSRSEYYHLLAEKIYKIQKELEEKRASRMRRVPGGMRMPTQNGPVQVNNLGSMVPGVRMPNAPLNTPRMAGVPVRMPQPMSSSSGTPNSVLSSNVPMSQNSQMEFTGDPIMMKFQQARDEIHQQRDGSSPMVGGNNQQFNAQSNSLQDPNSLSNNSLMGEVFGPNDIKPTLGQDGSVLDPGNSAGSLMGQVSQGGLEMSSSSNFDVKPQIQSAQPRLEKLLRETMPSSSTPTCSHGSNSFYGGNIQTTQANQQQMRFGSDQLNSQQPASLQDLLQGSGPSSASVTASTAPGSFVSLTSSAALTASNVLTSPPPFVSTQAGKDSKDGILTSSSSSVFSGTGKGKVKTENTVKTENEGNSAFESRGKPWSPNKSSVKSEVKMESEDQFNTMSPAVSSSVTTNHDPFVKQESMSDTSSSKTKIKAFDPLDLKVALLPVVEKLYKQEPEALPFRQPVDPEQLNIPDYFEIVKEPMDLASIRKNLDTGKYKEPWEFIADVWLMFNNAWLYNRRTTRVYKYCSKLKEIFEAEIDPVMQRLGYCCGRKLEFMPMTLCCYGKQLCTIPTGAVYFDYQNRYDYCEKCFNDIPGDTVTLADDPSKPLSVTTIPKSQFQKKKNDVHDPEPQETCNACGRKMHKICVLHMSPIWPEGFTCDECLYRRGSQRKPNRYSGLKLPQNKLSEHIEKRVNRYIKQHDTTGEAGHVHIRVVYSGEKTVEVRSGMKTRFVDTKEMPETFPYRAKAFFAFEEIDGVDVCFFGVHVQEYGSDAPRPNQRRVYLSYLDSVHFFRPRHLRTAVYHEILIGYFEYCKNLGYEFAHIWACPPCEGDDYIFHCHPPEQKIPKPKRLQDWYKKMLDKAISEQVIVDYKDIFHQAKEDRLQSARELPYFEGDFWPNVLEESIKEIEQEEEDRKQAEANEQAAAEESDQGSSGGLKNGKQNKKSKKANIKKTSQRSVKKKGPQVMNDLSDKLYQIMEKHKEVFFVIRLNSVEAISKMGPTVDPDQSLQCDLMDGRDAFLTLAREKHYEFSSLRRAKWSTMAMLIELHTNGQDKFSYMCNHCKNNVETRYQCTECDDFDLCISCYRAIGHKHKMVKVGFGLDEGTVGSPGSGSSNTKSSQIPVERCMQSLVHACQCRNANCNMPACYKMKKVVHHAKNCKKISSNTCPICRQFIALCYYHAKHCQEKKCPVAFCYNIKVKLKEQERQHRMRQAQLMKRRMKVMAQKSAQQSGPHTPAGVSNASMPNQSSPKIEGGMRKPQPSPMGSSQELSQTMGKIGQKGMPPGSQGMMISPQGDNASIAGSGGNTMMNQPQIASPHLGGGNQMGNPSGMMNQPQSQPMQQTGMISPAQHQNFGRSTYQSPPPMGAVRAAQQAQQLADRQARERERLNAFIPAAVPNNTAGNRPIQNPMPRGVVSTNTNTGNWGMANNSIRQGMRPMMPGQPSTVPGGSQPNMNTPQNQPTAALQSFINIVRNSSGSNGSSGVNPVGNQPIMALLKKNPQLLNSFIRERKQGLNKQPIRQQQQNKIFQMNNMPTSMGNMQQQAMVGMQQGNTGMQTTMNQSGTNMQPVQVNTMQQQQQQQQMQWQQQQQQQQHRMQSPHQGPYQSPAPPYQQAISQQRMLRYPRMPAQMRPQQINSQMVMQPGMNPQMSNMPQGMQNPIGHHPNMNPTQGVQGTRPPSQAPMGAGRPGMQQMQPHPMAGRTSLQNQGAVQQHLSNMEQSYNGPNSQNTMMGGGGFPHAAGHVYNNGGGALTPNQVNQGMGHANNPNANQGLTPPAPR